MSKEIYSVVISEDEYVGIPYKKIKDDYGERDFWRIPVSDDFFDYLTHDEKSVWEVFSGQAVES